MEMDTFYGQMEVVIREILWRIILMEKGCILEVMEGGIRANGRTIKCMEKEFLFGLIIGYMKGSM